MNLSQALNANSVTTENGMSTYASSLNANVDLFFKIGASRNKDLTAPFTKALYENTDLALRILLWSRDCREGSGERQTFRSLVQHLAKTDVELAKKVLAKVPELGRWDDLLCVVSKDMDAKFTELEYFVFEMIVKGLIDHNKAGLVAKWMPRKGPKAIKLRRYLGFGKSPKAYRKMLTKKTNVVEQALCAKNFDSINYGHVPSVAFSRYNKTFQRNDGERFGAFINKVKEGSAKINAKAVFPHDVIRGMLISGHGVNQEAINEQWKALPNYMEGNNKVILPIIDTSDSMTWFQVSGGLVPRNIAVGLGMYISERNEGQFKDQFISFNSNPSFHTLKGTVKDRYDQFMDWNILGGSTNVEAALELILKSAKAGNVPQSEMPEMLLIISDMQFDNATREWHKKQNPKAHEMIEAMYEEAGYRRPNVVFWNMDNRDNNQAPVKFDEKGYCMISGYSPSILTSLLKGDTMTPESIMLDTVMKERYNIEGD